uniref:Uncharacterized protein n=1 Tax=viral metagenome TaxID=1070528 RepID=A0A6C0AHQ6_9ZZZZ
MNVEKEDMVTIPIPTYSDYYGIKQKYEETGKCPNCKKTKMVFKVVDRILTATCTPSCTSNMRILEDTYITYDEYARQSKQDYEKSIEAILRAKFDRLFDYQSSSNLEQLRDHYLGQKEVYDNLYIQWEKSDPNHPQLKKDRDELISKLKTSDSPEIHTQLNHVLNELHKIEYTRIYNETVPTPVYDLEIRTL